MVTLETPRLILRRFGLFAVEIRSTGELAGFTGLSVPDFLPEVLPAVATGRRPALMGSRVVTPEHVMDIWPGATRRCRPAARR
jgi:hypothetical protein